MNKPQIDELYHSLRLLYLSNDEEQKQAILGIVSHLSKPYSLGGDYAGLLQFLSWYGNMFLVDRVCDIIRESRLKFTRVVELGAGLGWLGRALALEFCDSNALFVDKRQYALIDVVADLESKNGMKRVLDEMKAGDLVVMSELLHCLDNPAGVIRSFSSYPVLAIEYSPKDEIPEALSYKKSYNEQISGLGCEPILEFEKIFSKFRRREYSLFPYTVVVAEPL
jgi:hypothetical protein